MNKKRQERKVKYNYNAPRVSGLFFNFSFCRLFTRIPSFPHAFPIICEEIAHKSLKTPNELEDIIKKGDESQVNVKACKWPLPSFI